MKQKKCAKLCQTIQQKLEPKFQIYLNVETKKKRVEILSEITATGGGQGSGPVFIFDLPKLLIPPNYLRAQCSLLITSSLHCSILFSPRVVIWAQRTGFRICQLPLTKFYQILLFVAFINILLCIALINIRNQRIFAISK